MAQIKFFRGERNSFFNGADLKSDYAEAICFSTDSHEIIVNGETYGMSETLKSYLNEGQVISGVVQDGLKVTLSFANPALEDVVVDFSDQVATSEKNGLMSSEDKKNVDVLSEALVVAAEDGSLSVRVASESNDGLMSKDHVSLLQSLNGDGEGSYDDILNRVSANESEILLLQGEMDAVEGKIGDWTEKAETIAEAIGGLDGRVGTLEDQIQGLSGAMHFKGVVESDPTKLSAEELAGYENGDVVIFGEKEYVFSGKTEEAAGSFVEFGDVSAEGDRISALEGAVEALQGKDTEIEGSISALAERVTKNEGDITSVTTQAGENKTAIEALAGRVDAIEKDTTDADAIAALAEKVGDGFTKDSTVADAIAGLVSRMDAVDAEETGSIALLAARVKAIEDDQTCENSIKALEDRVKAIEDDKTCEEAIADHKARIEAVEDQLVWHDVTATVEPEA